ncbi:MAG: tetratricopeptide repeat protein [Bacteroidetes bacterium]|nr:tetratricopeptide repeat protein [Bacteroidota bacterium]
MEESIMSIHKAVWKKNKQKSNVREWRIGERLENRFELLDIKQGGMGILYVCYDHDLKHIWAMKTFQDKFCTEQNIVDRFVREALFWISFERHRHIVQAHSVENIEGKPYILLDYVVGHEGYGADLRSWLKLGALEVLTALDFAIQFCLGMEHVQKKVPGLIHRDIKPENILISWDRVLKVTDFGLIKVFESHEFSFFPKSRGNDLLIEPSSLTVVGSILGTPQYMSPEQCQGKPSDIRSDIYAFGCVFYEMLTGRKVFTASTIKELLRSQVIDPAPDPRKILSSLPNEVSSIVMKCLEKNPTQRFSDFVELREVLVDNYQFLTGREMTWETDTEALQGWELSNKASALQSLGYPNQALHYLDKALSVDPYNAKTWINKGSLLSELGLSQEAGTCYDRALDIDPNLSGAWLAKAEHLAKLGCLQEAIDNYEQAISINPDYIRAWDGKGKQLAALGRYKDAILCYDRVLAIDQNNWEVWMNKGVILRTLGCREQALSCYDRALEINPGLAVAWMNKGVLFKDWKRFEEALQCYDRALTIDPQLAEGWSNKGNILHKKGFFREALLCYEKALEVAPNFTIAWNNRGRVLDALKQPVEALKSYQQALKIDPKDSQALGLAAAKFMEIGNFNDAISCFDQMLEIDPNLELAKKSKDICLQVLAVLGPT